MNLLIADDHPVVRHGLRQMLQQESDFNVVGEASDGNEVMDLSNKVSWDVAVLDYHMPGKNGLSLLEKIKNLSSHRIGHGRSPFEDISNAIDEEFRSRAL